MNYLTWLLISKISGRNVLHLKHVLNLRSLQNQPPYYNGNKTEVIGAGKSFSLYPAANPFKAGLTVLSRSSLVWTLFLDLTAMGDPARASAADGIALGVMESLKPLHHDKVDGP